VPSAWERRSGIIAGDVTDATGVVVPGAVVRVILKTERGLELELKTATDDIGPCHLPPLRFAPAIARRRQPDGTAA
jgi:hypothetical protein